VVVTGSDYDDVPVKEDVKRKGKLSRLLGRRVNSASGQSASTDLPIKGDARDDKSSVIDEQQHQQTDETLTATAVGQELDESYRKDKLEYDKLFSAKLDEWKELKRLGLLDKLSGTVYEEDVFELDEEVSKRRLRRLRQRPPRTDRDEGQSTEDSTVEEASSVVMGAHELRAKYLSTKNSSLGLYSLLNEMKDKSLIESMPLSSNSAVHEEDVIDIMEQIMMSIARLDSPHHPVSALKLYLGYLQRGSIAPDRVDPLFLPRYVLQLYTSNLLSAADQCRDLLRLSPAVDADCVSDSRLLTGYICASIHQLASQLLTTNKNKADKLQLEQHLLSTIEEQLQQLFDKLRAYPLSEINAVLRVLAKYKLIDRIFSLLGEMRASGVQPNSESLEFLANALVGSVEKGRTASSMKDLPEPMAEVPEIVFVGRSNVGKSSLVNCILNRKVNPTLSFTAATLSYNTCLSLPQHLPSAGTSLHELSARSHQAVPLLRGQRRPPHPTGLPPGRCPR
jgi:pentatricopeptide repeat protein